MTEGTQADDIKMYKFHLFSFSFCLFIYLFFVMGVESGLEVFHHQSDWDRHLLTWPLQCLPMSVPDGHLMGMLKFNADDS